MVNNGEIWRKNVVKEWLSSVDKCLFKFFLGAYSPEASRHKVFSTLLKSLTYPVFADSCIPLSGKSWPEELVKKGPQDQHCFGSDGHFNRFGKFGKSNNFFDSGLVFCKLVWTKNQIDWRWSITIEECRCPSTVYSPLVLCTFISLTSSTCPMTKLKSREPIMSKCHTITDE